MTLTRQWANAVSRRELRDALARHLPFTVEELAARLKFENADPLDVLLNLAFDTPIRTRSERLASFTTAQQKFLQGFAPEAREILDLVLTKYYEHGPSDLDPEVLSVPPLSDLGSVTELAQRFGEVGRFRDVLDEVSRRLYEAS